MKKFLKMSLVIVMLIVLAFLLTGCGSKDNEIKGENDNAKSNANSNSNITEVKKEQYPNIFGDGDDKALLPPPQSYITRNIISVNPNKNERVVVNYADIAEPVIEYLVNDNRFDNVTVKYFKEKNIDLYEKRETYKGVDIYHKKHGYENSKGTTTYTTNFNNVDSSKIVYGRKLFDFG